MKTHAIFLLAILSALLGVGCQSAERMLDQGRYDDLLALAEKRMAGKKENQEKYVLFAEDAFRKATERDMDRIERLKASNRSEDWEEIRAIAKRIQYRQDRLEPFLPLVSESGYQASFTFVKAHEILLYAEDKIIEKLYDEGVHQMTAARNGDKAAAQQAYNSFEEVLRLTSGYRDAVSLKEEARSLGVVHVLLHMENNAHQMMPAYVAQELEDGIITNSSFWTQYHMRADQEDDIDYVATFVVSQLEVGPDAIREERIPRKRKVEDGWEYVLDNRGNVAKDSLGNDIKRPKYINVEAVVIKTHQEKAVFLKGRLEVEDAKRNYSVETRPFVVESRFYHQAQSFFGDERALDSSDKNFVSMLPFPSDEAMMLEVAGLAKPVFAAELEKCRNF